MDIQPPFSEEHKVAPGEQYARFAGALTEFVSYIGGPKLNQDAVSVIIADFFAWLKH